MLNDKFAANNSNMAKQQFNFRFEPELIKEIEKLAKKENRTLTNYIETLLINHVSESKQKKK